MDTNDHVHVLIVDDEAQYLQRCTAAVLADPGLRLTGAVTSGAAAIALLDHCPPDVMLIDPGLPDMLGIEVIRHAVERCPHTHILVVAASADAGYVLACIEEGATGYLLKDVPAPRICVSIHELHDGGASIGPGMARHVLECFRQTSATATPATPLSGAARNGSPVLLSQRESDILRLVAKGMAFAEVGVLLSISPHTVVTHVKKIYRKLAVHSRGEAVFEAGQMGLL